MQLEEKIIGTMSAHEGITARETAALLGVTFGRCIRCLYKLKREGKVARVGSKKNAIYKIERPIITQLELF